mgnify:CR=1 FL=1
MNQYITGTVIKELRNRYDMTQMELGEKLGVSAKTISKWETGKGYPDITLLEPIAEVFSVSVTELISGNIIRRHLFAVFQDHTEGGKVLPGDGQCLCFRSVIQS